MAGYYPPYQTEAVRGTKISPNAAGQSGLALNQFVNAAIKGQSTLGSLMGLRNAASYGWNGQPGGFGMGVMPEQVPEVGPINTDAADAAAFARAKDTAGQIGRSSLDSLRGALGETGQLGSGAEAQASRDIVQRAAGAVGDINREQAIQHSQRAFETAKTNQAAGITQRGQNIQLEEAQMRLQQQYAQMQAQQQFDLLKSILGSAGQFMY